MGRLKKVGRDERGISAVVAVVALLGIFAGATLSVDAGNVWQTRRNMVTATDASALAEAGEIALAGGTTCTGLYNSVLNNNAGSDVYDRKCTLTLHPTLKNTGYITVEGRKPITVRFGAVLGLKDTNAYSLSAAMFGIASEARGLRPIGICSANEHVQLWKRLKEGSISQSTYDSYKGLGDVDLDGNIDYPVTSVPGKPTGKLYSGFGVVHRIYFNKANPTECGSFPGNWGWLSFDGLPADVGDRREWLENGYDGPVRIRLDSEPACPGIPGSGDADDSAEGCVPTDSGSGGSSTDSSLDVILDKPIHVMVFDAGACSGGGTTCGFEAWAFVGVILRGYKLNGPESTRFFDFEFTNIQVSGRCCDTSNVDLGTRAIELCAVDHDSKAITHSDRCGNAGG